ncbi:sigma-70 family RNA polymerase sigma factor [Microbacterium sp. W4I20]|uniref:sigma-70 family RNA polymerase sigma factor n=1 Tax=Microbacterium sp. W4I20 TaxID=3042262 RepID=UPI0027847308|nr:sigma-70 family RNA polymerase sigma factor [Microbacterium sp. W4I20]MDQ0726464.1 RNA polymerase sigma factor (sigma-70 family) [Microbacterium sp. W4I20]
MANSGEHTGGDSDAHLLRLSREGDRRAFSELWRRHAPTAVAYARSLGAAPPDPEDVVSDAFVRILQLLRTGKGPEERFRPYLLTTVRNTWLTASRRAPATVPLDAAEDPPSRIGTVDIEAMVNSAALSEAFCALPERWQHALWLSEVEQLPPREIAEVLGLRPNAVAALTYRARDGLRKAWIGAHLRRAPAGSDHVRVIELLGSHVQGDLGPRPQKFVDEHLASCGECRAAESEARHLARAITLGPLLVGGAGLVIAPTFFPVQQAAATVLTDTANASGLLGTPAALQPAVAAVGHAAPVLWPVAASVAIALAVGGALFTRTPTEPDATVVAPAIGVSPPAASPETSAPTPAPPAPTLPAPETLPTPEPFPAPEPAPAPDPPQELSPPVSDPPVGDLPVDGPPVDGPPVVSPPADDRAAIQPPDADSDVTTAPADGVEEIPGVLPYSALPATTVPVTVDALPPAPLIDLSVFLGSSYGIDRNATVSITGPSCATLMIVIGDQDAGLTVQLDAQGLWSGRLPLPSAGERYALSVYRTSPDGAVADLAARRQVWP